jgi:hypothetical protein
MKESFQSFLENILQKHYTYDKKLLGSLKNYRKNKIFLNETDLYIF